jgi:glycerate kinase
MTQRILIAPDKFKGSLSALEVARALELGLRASGASITLKPIADGGDGTADIFIADGFTQVNVDVKGPLGDKTPSYYAMQGKTAVVELAKASGLAILSAGEHDPMRATSYGTGQLIAAAIEAGCTQILLAIGGSACTDGGAGMLQALGAQLNRAGAREIPAGGGMLSSLVHVDLRRLEKKIAGIEFIVLTDVDNPLLGERGAAAVFSPQKGATPEQVKELDSNLAHFAQFVDPASVDLPGAGAAGGVGYAAMGVLGAQQRSGIEFIAQYLGVTKAISDCDILITGEGSFDEQSSMGKGPYWIAEFAKSAGKKVVVVCGTTTIPKEKFGPIYQLIDFEPDLQKCFTEASSILTEIGAAIGSTLL